MAPQSRGQRRSLQQARGWAGKLASWRGSSCAEPACRRVWPATSGGVSYSSAMSSAPGSLREVGREPGGTGAQCARTRAVDWTDIDRRARSGRRWLWATALRALGDRSTASARVLGVAAMSLPHASGARRLRLSASDICSGRLGGLEWSTPLHLSACARTQRLPRGSSAGGVALDSSLACPVCASGPLQGHTLAADWKVPASMSVGRVPTLWPSWRCYPGLAQCWPLLEGITLTRSLLASLAWISLRVSAFRARAASSLSCAA